MTKRTALPSTADFIIKWKSAKNQILKEIWVVNSYKQLIKQTKWAYHLDLKILELQCETQTVSSPAFPKQFQFYMKWVIYPTLMSINVQKFFY